MALLESQTLKQNVDEQSQLNQSLEKELTKVQASLRLATAVVAAPDAAEPEKT